MKHDSPSGFFALKLGALRPGVLVVIVCLMFNIFGANQLVQAAAEQKIKSEAENDGWWAERAAAFFPKYHFTLSPTGLPLFTERNTDLASSNTRAPNAPLATVTWDGGSGGNANWDTAGNWSIAGTPAATDDVVFATAFTSGTAINLNGNRTVNSLSITSTTDFSLNNNVLTITNGDITRSAASGTTTINSGIALGGAAAWDISGNLIANGIISGAQPLTKTGSGTLTFGGTAANTYSGLTTVSAGTLLLSKTAGVNAIAGALTIGDGTGVDTVQLTAANQIIDSSAVTINSSGVLDLGGFSETIGSLSGSAGGSVTLGAGTLTLSATTSTAYAGTISGTGGLTKAAAATGTLTLSGANSYSGLTTVSGGALNIQDDTALGTTAAGTTVASGAALQLQGDITVGAEALTLNGAGVSGAGGALRNISGDNSYAGVITLGSASRINSDAGTLTLDSAGNITGATFGLTVGGSGNVIISDAINTTTGTLTKDGTGTLTLAVANGYTGASTISLGTVILQNNTSLGTTAAGTTVASGAAVHIDGSGLNIAEAITDLAGNGGGGGALRNLANNNTWSGALTISTGARINSDANLLTLSGAINESGGAVKDLTIGGAGDVTISGQIIGGADLSIVKDGSGTLTLSGGLANTEVSTTVNAGTLKLSKTAGVDAVGGALIIGDGTGTDTVLLTAANQIANTSAVTINSSGVFDLNGNNETILTLAMTAGSVTTGTGTLTLGGTVTGIAAATSATISGNLALGGNRTFTIANGAALEDMAISAVISGAFTLTKNDLGTLALSGANTYTGTTTVSAGVLNIQNATGLGTTAGSTTVSSGATLQLQNGITVGTEALNISGVGASGQTGALVNVSGTNNYGGLLTLGATSTISSDSGTLNLTNTGTITGAGLGLTLTGSGDGTVSSIIGTTTGTLTKSGTGTWTLSGANTYTGATTVSAGTLSLDYGTSNTSKLSNGAALNLGGGTLNLSGGSHTELVASTTLNAGASSVTRTSGTSVLQMNAITRNAGSTVNFGAGSIANTDTINLGGNGILGGYATVGAVTGAADWAASVNAGAADTAITAFTTYAAFATTGTNTNNELLTGSSTLTGNAITNSLKIDTSGSGQSLNIVSGQTLTTTSGGLMFIGVDDYQINNGTLKSGTATNSDLIVQQWGAGTLTINSVIANGVGASTLTKAGTGTLVLGAANTYTGTTFVNAGTVLVNNTTGSGTGSGAVTVNGSGTVLGGTGTISGAVTVNANAILQGGTGTTGATQKLTLTGVVTLADNSIIQLALGPSGAHSTLARTGANAWTFDSNQAFTFIDLGATTGTYQDIITGIANPPSEGSWTITNDQWSGTFIYDGANIDLNLTAVPEPSTWIGGALAFGVIGWSQRRRFARLVRRTA